MLINKLILLTTVLKLIAETVLKKMKYFSYKMYLVWRGKRYIWVGIFYLNRDVYHFFKSLIEITYDLCYKFTCNNCRINTIYSAVATVNI